jgi:hypothetical protein
MTNKCIVALFILPALVAMCAISGCGSDEPTEASLTKAQYRHQTDVICTNASVELSEGATNYISEHPEGNQADLVKKAGLPPLEKALQKLQDLPASDGYQAETSAFIEQFETALERTREEPLLMVAQPNSFEEANRIAAKYRFGECELIP